VYGVLRIPLRNLLAQRGVDDATIYKSEGFLFMSNNLIKRTKRTHNFTMLMNEVFQSKLQADSLGVLCYLLSLPDDWVLHKTHLMKHFGIGREKMDRIFKELEASGFMLAMNMIRTQEGKFIGRSYIVYDLPTHSEPLTAKPSTAKPLTARPTSNKNLSDKELILQRTNTTKAEEKKSASHDMSERERWVAERTITDIDELFK
jgi:hypothetical protein